MKKTIDAINSIENREMNRREAIKKMGYLAATTSMMMVLLNTQSARATSLVPGSITTNTGGTSGTNSFWNEPE